MSGCFDDAAVNQWSKAVAEVFDALPVHHYRAIPIIESEMAEQLKEYLEGLQVQKGSVENARTGREGPVYCRGGDLARRGVK